MDKLSLSFCLLLFLCYASCGTYIKYPIDHFAVYQPTIVQPPYPDAYPLADVNQIEDGILSGIRVVYGWIFPGTIQVPGDGHLYYNLEGGSYPSHAQLGYQTFQTPTDRSDTAGIQMFINNALTISEIHITLITLTAYNEITISNILGSQSGTLLKVLYTDFPEPVTGLDKITAVYFQFVFYAMSFDISAIDFFAVSPLENTEFSGAIEVVPTATVAFDNTDSPDDAVLTQCDDLSHASSFLWYKIQPANTIRFVSVDTCNSPFDTVIGVFSGTSENDLQLVDCNDDSTNLGEGCNPTSSSISNINIDAGEVIYVVVGGFYDTELQSFDAGEGSITFALAEIDICVTLEMIVQQRELIEVAISGINSGITDQIDELETSIIGNSNGGVNTLQSAVQGVSQQVSEMAAETASSFGELSTSVGEVGTSVDDVSSQLTTSSNDIKTNTQQTVFTQTYLNYLSDSSATAPLNIRMPNEYGGKMNDIASDVVSLYNSLKSQALTIGAKGSTLCNNNGFCNYFLGTGEPAYLDAMSKYSSNLTTKKFKMAYLNLQKAYTSLYPSSW